MTSTEEHIRHLTHGAACVSYSAVTAPATPAAPAVAQLDAAAAARARQLLDERAELRHEAEAINALVTRVEAELISLLRGAEEARADGATLYACRPDGTFAARRFAGDHPALAAEFTTLAPVFDTKTFANTHPALYREYRARVLRAKETSTRG
jgi:hypothetical protein